LKLNKAHASLVIQSVGDTQLYVPLKLKGEGPTPQQADYRCNAKIRGPPLTSMGRGYGPIDLRPRRRRACRIPVICDWFSILPVDTAGVETKHLFNDVEIFVHLSWKTCEEGYQYQHCQSLLVTTSGCIPRGLLLHCISIFFSFCSILNKFTCSSRKIWLLLFFSFFFSIGSQIYNMFYVLWCTPSISNYKSSSCWLSKKVEMTYNLRWREYFYCFDSSHEIFHDVFWMMYFSIGLELFYGVYFYCFSSTHGMFSRIHHLMKGVFLLFW